MSRSSPRAALLLAQLELDEPSALAHLSAVLCDHDTLAGAAAALGFSRSTLHRLLTRRPGLRPAGWAPVGWRKGRARGQVATQ